MTSSPETPTPAGRETDARIAETVMGCVRVIVNDRGELYGAPPHLIASGDIPAEHGRVRLPSYSTDIAAAWLVVEHLKSRGWSVRLSNKTVDWCWWCYVYDYRSENAKAEATVQEETAPLAICRAALAAVEASHG